MPRKKAISRGRFVLRPGISNRSFSPAWLVLLAVLPVAISPAFAQSSPQQYVYLSTSSGAPPSSVSGLSKASLTGALTLIPGSPFNERLEGGLVAIDGQGKFLFVLNPTSNDISMFQIAPATGGISEVPKSPFAFPPIFSSYSPPSLPSSIATERSGQFVFVGYGQANGADSSGFSAVVSFAIDTSGPSPVLRPVSSVLIQARPIKLLTDSKGLHLYAGLGGTNQAMPASGAELFDFDSAGNLLGGGLTASTAINFGFDYAIDPQDRFIFELGGAYPEYVVTCVISPVDGNANTCGTPLYIGSGGEMLVESSGRFLYLTNSNPGVAVFSIDQGTGATTQVGSATAIFSGKGTEVADPMGPYIYSAEFVTPTTRIHVYQVDQQTGNLTEISGSPFSTGAVSGCCGGLAISGNPPLVSGPAATLYPSSASTFNAVVGTVSASQVFSVVNGGSQTLSINSISIVGANASSFSQTNTCSATLAPNANCSVSIAFTPPSVGTFSATLQVADNAPGSPQTLSLSGTGIAPAPAVSFSLVALSFPTTTQGASSAPQTLTVTSTGNATLHISSVSLGGPNPSDFSFTNNCPATLAPSANCTISLVFSPIALGQRTANLLISDDAPGSPQTVALSGTANPAFTAGPAPGGSTSVSVSAGQTAQFQLQLTPGSGFTGAVSLSCSGAPLGAVCQVPSSISLTNGAAAPFTVTVTTSGPAALPPSARLRLPPITLVPLLPLFAALLMISLIWNRAARSTARTRLALSGVLAVLLCAIALSNLAGCGGGSTPPPVITPSGNFTITVTPSAMSSTGQPLQLSPIQLTLTVK